MKDPCVAVLLAAYNGEKYIGQQIESVLTQNYQNIRLIISDDFSSDGTAECIREYALKDERITLLQGEKRMGSAQANFMFLLKMPKLIIICFVIRTISGFRKKWKQN